MLIKTIKYLSSFIELWNIFRNLWDKMIIFQLSESNWNLLSLEIHAPVYIWTKISEDLRLWQENLVLLLIQQSNLRSDPPELLIPEVLHTLSLHRRHLSLQRGLWIRSETIQDLIEPSLLVASLMSTRCHQLL